MSKVYQLSVYVPSTHVEMLKKHLGEVGAGRYKNYDNCFWQTLGSGQFRPLGGSNPYLGNIGTIESVEEYKIECLVSDKYLPEVITKIHEVHPYEEPAYYYVEVKTF